MAAPRSGGDRRRAKNDPAALGILPEWNLGDLYPSTESSELKADLARANELAVAFEAALEG